MRIGYTPVCPLSLRAVFVPCAGIDPERSEVAVAISFLDRLWCSSEGEWRHGHPAAEVSTSADLHCASAIRSIRRAWRGFDPVRHILKSSPREPRTTTVGGDKPHTVKWSDGVLTVLSADGTTLVSRPFSKQATKMRALLDALVDRWAQEGLDATHESRSLSTLELQRLAGIKDVYEYIRRLNVAVGSRSVEQRGRSCVVIERIESGQGPLHDRYVLLGRRLVLSTTVLDTVPTSRPRQ